MSGLHNKGIIWLENYIIREIHDKETIQWVDYIIRDYIMKGLYIKKTIGWENNKETTWWENYII